MTEPLLVQPHELRELRFATLDRLLEDTRVLEGHLTNAVEKEHGLAVRDAQSWGRMVRETLGLLDTIGWPTDATGPMRPPADERGP